MEAIISIPNETSEKVSNSFNECIESTQSFNVRERLLQNADWFAEIQPRDGEAEFFGADNYIGAIREKLINGKYSSNDNVLVHAKDENSEWKSSPFTLRQLAKENFDLNILYTPVREHALSGLKLGVLAGMAIKLLDTMIMLFMADPAVGFLFVVAIALVFVPRIGMLGSLAAGFFLTYLFGFNIFLIIIGSALSGAILGALPGMGIGGIIGLIRKSSIARAHDAGFEPESYAFTMAVLPMASGIALVLIYLFVINPWLASQLL